MTEKEEMKYYYWLERKKAYEISLKNNVGHKASIEQLLERINEKLTGGYTLVNK